MVHVRRYSLPILSLAAILAVMVAGISTASAQDAASVVIHKDCGGLTGRLTLSLTLKHGDATVSASGQIDCGQTETVSQIPTGFESQPISLLSGDTLTITED